FDLESIQKKGLKPAAKQLSRYQAANDFVVAWVSLQCLGGHVFPLDNVALRVLRRLQLVDDVSLDAVQSALESQIPRTKAAAFVDLLSTIGQDYCHEERPACTSCPARSQCPTGQNGRPNLINRKPR
ncbi:MAG: hypothetical protein NZO58_08965, partial [Gemmataceae bacterium]|nr:hypothetical protein [Gemmataceae bacterium]